MEFKAEMEEGGDKSREATWWQTRRWPQTRGIITPDLKPSEARTPDCIQCCAEQPCLGFIRLRMLLREQFAW